MTEFVQVPARKKAGTPKETRTQHSVAQPTIMSGSTAAPAKSRPEKVQQPRVARHMERPKSTGALSRGPTTPNERSRSALRNKREAQKPLKHIATLMEI